MKDIIGKTDFLKLNYKQNSIGFKFTSNNYISPNKNKFKYRLKGFDDTWIETDYRSSVNFTNLPHGNFIFELKTSNNDNIWSETPLRINITITPPIWLTWFAYMFYTLCFIASICFFRKQIINRENLKLAIKISKIQKDTSEKLHQTKLQFFTNISHEFKTPLTLIKGPVNRLIKAGGQNDFNQKQLLLIKNNTNRLLKLINQLLDFRRIDYGKLELTPTHNDIVSFSKNVFDCFEEYATQRGFNFNFTSYSPTLTMDYDSDKLDKVLVNLISNAFKHSKDKGSISLKIQKNKKSERQKKWKEFTIGDNLMEDFVEISIIDSGKGISSNNLPKVFERFFQIEKDNTNMLNTGIGLSFCVEYIKIHNGQLVVSSLEGKGSAFYIYLPIYQPNTLYEVINKKKPSLNTFDFATNSESNINFKLQNENSNVNRESLILIVEDNLELLDFLEESLQNHFKIIKSKNGKEAFDLALNLYPDLIISDVMMPEMNGIQLCEKIKNDVRTSHTPVILLSALSEVRDKISGIHSGADAYISKPYNEDYLIIQINNLLNSRKMLRTLYASKQEKWNENLDNLSLDKKLLQRAINIIEKNIENSDFTVEDLGKILNISRTHLHRKLKSLTNQSTTEFINNIRFKHAIKLMSTGNYLVNEIGFRVGFNSHSYFTKAFKKKYGISPNEFMKKMNRV